MGMLGVEPQKQVIHLWRIKPLKTSEQ